MSFLEPVQSKVLRVARDDQGKAIYEKHVAGFNQYTRKSSWDPYYTAKVQSSALFPMTFGVLQKFDKESKEYYQFGQQWHPSWAIVPLTAAIPTFAREIQRFDVKNFIHPSFTHFIPALALTFTAASLFNTYSFCKKAGLDDKTTSYQMAATGTYQALNNFMLPAVVFKSITRSLCSKLATPQAQTRNTAIIYSAAAAALFSSLALESKTKFACEEFFMNRLLRQKSYGLGGQAFHENSLQYDNYWNDWVEKSFDWSGDDYMVHEPIDQDTKITALFPGFALAEAAPVWEVPYNGHNIVTLEPAYVQGAIFDNAVESLNQRSIPAPTPGTYLRHSKTYFGEYSIATPSQAAFDEKMGFDWYLSPNNKTFIDDNAIDRVRAIRLATMLSLGLRRNGQLTPQMISRLTKRRLQDQNNLTKQQVIRNQLEDEKAEFDLASHMKNAQ
jgi:hypothetical protein